MHSVCNFVFILGLVYICGYCIRIITVLLVGRILALATAYRTSVNGCTLSLSCISIFESAVSEIN